MLDQEGGTKRPMVISLFAGCGGSSLGYKMAGFKELLAIDIDPFATSTFKKNFPEIPVWTKDIKQVSTKEILGSCGIIEGELDVLDGSPPCQGFSTAGKREMSDPRNMLFFDYCRVLSELKPRIFIGENVKGMILGKMVSITKKIIDMMSKSGYHVKLAILNTMNYNVPQSRERVIFVGIRNDLFDVIQKIPNFNFFPKALSRPIASGTVLQNIKLDGPPASPSCVSVLKYVNNGIKLRKVGKMMKENRRISFTKTKLNLYMPAPTIVTIPALFSPVSSNFLSLSALKRLSSFPDSFIIEGSYIKCHKLIGNSVPPLFMKAIAEHVRTFIDT